MVAGEVAPGGVRQAGRDIMARLFGKNFTRKELLDRVGDISQLGGARQSKLVGGMEDGVDVVEFRTGSGLNFTAVPGGLWISASPSSTDALWRGARPRGKSTRRIMKSRGLVGSGLSSAGW